VTQLGGGKSLDLLLRPAAATVAAQPLLLKEKNEHNQPACSLP